MTAYTRLGPSGFPIAVTVAVANAQVAGVVITASTSLLVGSSYGSAVQPDKILSASADILAGSASGGQHITIGGVSPPPRFWFLQPVDAKVRGRVLRTRCKIIPGEASGTVTTIRFWAYGSAIGTANVYTNVYTDNVITLRQSVSGGIATGEKYLTDEEQLMIMLEAA